MELGGEALQWGDNLIVWFDEELYNLNPSRENQYKSIMDQHDLSQLHHVMDLPLTCKLTVLSE